MGMKLVTNEFVVMGKVTGVINQYPEHLRAVLTTFVTSFANFGTLGMIIGAFKGLVGKEDNDYIATNIGYLLLSGDLSIPAVRRNCWFVCLVELGVGTNPFGRPFG